MRVLVLRPREAGARTAQALAARGHEAILAPLLAPAPAGAPLPEGQFDALLATSAQAFEGQAFAQAPKDRLAALRGLPIHVVGARTAEAARAAGFHAIGFVEPDAARLAARLTGVAAPSRLLYLAGVERKSGLENALAKAGSQVVAWEVYDARTLERLPEAARLALETGGADAALHFSKRSAQTFCALASDAGLRAQAARLRHVAISADAAAGLADLSPADLSPADPAPIDLRVAATPDLAGMLAALG